MPVPCMVRAKDAATVIVKELRLLNVMLATVVSAEIPTEVVLDRPKVAVSVVALGTVPDDQFVPVFQSPEPGLASHVPLPAKVVLLGAESKTSSVTAAKEKARARSRGSAGAAQKSGGAMCVFFLRRLKLVFISLVL
jgi:hypothetical protein